VRLLGSQACFFHLRRLQSSRQQLGRYVTVKLVVALVFSRLDYCSAVLPGLPAATLAPLQRVLHAATCLVNGLRPHDHVTLTLKEVHWLPTAQRVATVVYRLGLLVYKAIGGQTRTYSTDLLTVVADVSSRSARRMHRTATLSCQELD
jgi:hypothetical protein